MTADGTPKKPRAARQECSSRVRIAIAGIDEIEERYATNLSQGGMFIRDEAPPPVGSLVALEFVLPDGSCLCRVAGRVMHAKPALSSGETTAGMGIKFVEFDELASQLAERLCGARQVPHEDAWHIPVERRVETLAPPERAPLITIDGPVVGIDLGTVNSCVAYFANGRPYVLSSSHGYQIIPSVVFVAKDGGVLVGHRAIEKMILAPGRAVYGSKRFLGRPYASKEVHTLGHFFKYELCEGQNGRVAARIEGRVLPLEEVAAHILRALKTVAEEQLCRPVGRAIITVPAYFGETQRQAVRDAGRMAGLYVERILNEPTAAAIAAGWGRDALGTVLVYDLGGGTFDVAVLRVDGARAEVLAADGDPFLGGTDFDDRLTEFVLMRFARSEGIDLRGDAVAVQRIRFAVEMAKKQLSETMTAEVCVPYVCKRDDAFVDLKVILDRETLEALTHDLVERTFALMQRVLDTVKIKAGQLEDVIMVGGQTRSPHVRRLLAQRFARTPSSNVHPDEAVALGAAIIANAIESKRPVSLIDILPASIRLAAPDGSTAVLIPRGARLPATTDFEVAPETAVEPEYRVVLCRGEAEAARDNTPVGMVRLPGSLSLSLGGSKASASLQINAEGLLSLCIRHPMTQQSQQLEISLLAALL